jgi:hypothetical protein
MDVLVAQAFTTIVSASVAVIGITAVVVGSFYVGDVSVGCERVFMC